MKEIQLRPIKETTEDFEKLERAIILLFKREIYFPLLKELSLPQTTIKNSEDEALLEAIRSGRVIFSQGTFSGKFNAQISKALRALGATWDRKTSTYKILSSKLPVRVRSQISVSFAKFQETAKAIDKRLAAIVPEEIADKLKVERIFDSSIWKVDQNIKSTLRGITISPSLSETQREVIASEWQNNMRLWVKDFTQQEIFSLRKRVQESAFAGNRYESTAATIKKSFGVSERKAKFLARQETSLLMAKFKESRYMEAGVSEYRWACVAGSKNHPVRKSHKNLEGKIFRWDDPPVTTESGEPVRRNNPGQDYNCRCFAKPIVRFKEKK